MIRFACALSMGLFVAGFAVPVQAQTVPASGQAAKAGQNCKKVYVQKKSARTGKYVHVPRQRCS